MARKLCEFCGTRTATSHNRGNISIQACEPCEIEAGWENIHTDNGHEDPTSMGFDRLSELQDCWICKPELNRASAAYVKPERKGHHSPRRPQINHRACSHAQTPLARRTCRKAYWAKAAMEMADAQGTGPLAAPVLTAQYTGLVEYDNAKGAVQHGTIVRDLGAGKMLVKTARGGHVQLAFSALRLPA